MVSSGTLPNKWLEEENLMKVHNYTLSDLNKSIQDWSRYLGYILPMYICIALDFHICTTL